MNLLLLYIILDSLPPPSNIQLISVSSEQVVFNWTSVESNCSTLHYNIMSNCGTCPHTIESTANSVTCFIDLSASAGNITLCAFGVQSVICANISGNFSTPLNLTLKRMNKFK